MTQKLLELLGKPEAIIMGILNVTPDSFSDGGKFVGVEQAVAHAQQMQDEGASIIDIGGESTRPGAAAVTVNEELQRTIPVIEALVNNTNCLISIDTSKPEVMQAAVEAGACLINDVRALQEPGALEMAASLNVPVCLMHMQGQPRVMQENPQYDDVVGEVKAFLSQRIEDCVEAGIARDKLIIDQGFGFGKTLEHNLTLFKHMPEFVAMGYPLLVGVSRKSMIDKLLGRAVDERLPASLGMAALSAWMGAKLIRVHDVRESHDAVRMVEAIKAACT